MKFLKWRPIYDRLADQFAEQHFGGWGGVISLFAPDRPLSLKWKDKDTFPGDVYIVKKLANEYHGLERHAQQYHVSGQYDYAYHHWLMAACWRKENMDINNFTDEKHRKAVDFDLRCSSYNKALHDWFVDRRTLRKVMPEPYNFGIKSVIIDKKDQKARSELDAVFEKYEFIRSDK